MNCYWTKDYYTGVNLLKGNLRLHSDELQAVFDAYKQFQDDCWLPFCKSLLLLKDNPMTKPLVEYWTHQDMEQMLQVDILCVLEKNLSHLNKFISDLNSVLDPLLHIYSNDLSVVKENKYECERLIDLIDKYSREKDQNVVVDVSKVDGMIQQQQQIDEHQDEEQNGKVDQRSFALEFPLSIDNDLTFQDLNEFRKFINDLKIGVKLEKNLMSSLQYDKFVGTSLLDQLKSLNIDKSLFNLNRLAQELLTLKIIKTYNISNYLNIISEDNIWNENNYYIWNDIFDSIGSSSDDINEPAKVVSNPISSWFSSFNKLSIENSSNVIKSSNQNNSINLEETIVQLNNYQDKFFQKFNKLEYDKLQLEQNLYNFIKRKEEIVKHNRKVLSYCKEKFNQILRKFNNQITISDNLENSTSIENGEANSFSTLLNINFYTRDNCVPFSKYFVHNFRNDQNNASQKNEDEKSSIHKSSSCQHSQMTKFYLLGSVFGIRKINKDTVDTVEFLIHIIEVQTKTNNIKEVELLKIWQNNINLTRVINLKKEYHTTFLDVTVSDKINYNTIKRLYDENKSTSKILLADWIDLLKLFLLELPDSIIPSLMVDQLNLNDLKWLDLLPLENLQILILLAKYLKLMEPETIRSFLFEFSEMPFYHLVFRLTGVNSKDLNDKIARYSEFFFDLITNKLQFMLATLESKQNKTTSSLNTLIQPPTIEINGNLMEELPPTLDLPKRGNSSHEKLTATPKNLHKRSLSATAIFDSLKNLTTDNDDSNDDADFVPLPFKTMSTPSSPDATSNKEKRKSGINLLLTTSNLPQSN